MEETGEEVYDLGHHLRALKLSHCCTCRELLFVLFCIVCGFFVGLRVGYFCWVLFFLCVSYGMQTQLVCFLFVLHLRELKVY